MIIKLFCKCISFSYIDNLVILRQYSIVSSFIILSIEILVYTLEGASNNKNLCSHGYKDIPGCLYMKLKSMLKSINKMTSWNKTLYLTLV